MRVRLVSSNMFKPASNFLIDRCKAGFLLWVLFCYKSVLSVCLCHTVMSVPCSLVVTCCEMADLWALLCMMFSCVFGTFLNGILGQVLYLIVSIPLSLHSPLLCILCQQVMLTDTVKLVFSGHLKIEKKDINGKW